MPDSSNSNAAFGTYGGVVVGSLGFGTLRGITVPGTNCF